MPVGAADRRIGYTESRHGFDADSIAVLVSLNRQSPDIALGVDRDGAGDQGMMFGYAGDETDEYMPMPVYLAHKLTRRLTEVRKTGVLPYLGPDGKSQVTIEYRDGVPVRVDTVVISAQHSPDVGPDVIRKDILREVVGATIPAELLDKNTKYFVNPTGRFVVGGPHGDTGLTGRKIIVDTYGGFANRGYPARAQALLGRVGRGGATQRSGCPSLRGRSGAKFATTRRRVLRQGPDQSG